MCPDFVTCPHGSGKQGCRVLVHECNCLHSCLDRRTEVFLVIFGGGVSQHTCLPASSLCPAPERLAFRDSIQAHIDLGFGL